VTDPERYFEGANPQSGQRGSWVRWDGLEPFAMLPGLTFQPVLGDRLMVNFVTFQPHTEAPVHWHDEEQITYVMDGELEFEVAGETRLLRRGEAVVIPPNVPHGARTHDSACLEVDVFHPPRQGVIEAMGLERAATEPGE
jgi:quercetin dioxygenase-like cupin family protein